MNNMQVSEWTELENYTAVDRRAAFEIESALNWIESALN